MWSSARRMVISAFVVCLVAQLAAVPAEHRTLQKETFSAPAALDGGALLAQLPLTFIENRGQLDSAVSYYAKSPGANLYFTSAGVTMQLPGRVRVDATEGDPASGWAVKLDFVGARPDARPIAEAPTGARINYFSGAPDQWRTDLPTYSRLIYHDLWPGIDLVYAGDIGALKYEFVVHPGADPAAIRLTYRGATGLQVNLAGQLEVTTPAGMFVDEAPYTYQEIAGVRVTVASAYAVSSEAQADGSLSYGFTLGDYNPDVALVIDPALIFYSGYIGSLDQQDYAHALAVDSAGNAYVAGHTGGAADIFPVNVGPDLTYNGGDLDAFVAKVRADGTGLVYAGYIGGAQDDYGYGIAVDAAGAAYVVGQTWSGPGSFPVIGGPDLTFGGLIDGWIAKVAPDGSSLVYAGYMGGSEFDTANGVALDGNGIPYVVGTAASDDSTFAGTVGPDLTSDGDDAFVAKVAADGSGFTYLGFIGGSSAETGNGIAVDAAGNAYVTGETRSSAATFPVSGGPGLELAGGSSSDAYIAKVRADGTGLVYAGYIGGSSREIGNGIAVDANNNAYVVGRTASRADFPLVVGPDSTPGFFDDAFIAKVSADGTSLVYAGYINGDGEDDAFAVAVDATGAAYVTGMTRSREDSFPVSGTLDQTYNEFQDAFLAKVKPDGTAFEYLGYIGGDNDDIGRGIVVSGAGVYIAGYTQSAQATFPVRSGPDVTFNFGFDAFVVKVIDTSSLEPRMYLPFSGR